MVEPCEWRNLADLHSANAFGGEHAFRRVGLHDLGHQQSRELRQRAAEERHVARFDSIVQLVGERALELLHDADHVDP